MIDNDLLREADVAERIGVSRATISRWRQTGQGPAYIKAGKGIRYRRSDILDWEHRRTISPPT